MRKTVLLLSIIFLFICGGCTTQDLSSFSVSEQSHWDVSKIEEGNKNTSSAFETEQSKQTKEILNKSSKKNLETLITHSYPQKSIIETVNFLCSDNMSTLLNTLNEKYPVECLRTFQNSLDYVIYRLDEGGYLYVFFHGTSLKFADCIFVVKKPLQKEDFSEIKEGSTLADVENIDPGVKLIHSISSYYLVEPMTYHMVQEGFVRIEYQSAPYHSTTAEYDVTAKVKSVRFIAPGEVLTTPREDFYPSKTAYRYYLLPQDYPQS